MAKNKPKDQFFKDIEKLHEDKSDGEKSDAEMDGSESNGKEKEPDSDDEELDKIEDAALKEECMWALLFSLSISLSFSVLPRHILLFSLSFIVQTNQVIGNPHT